MKLPLLLLNVAAPSGKGLGSQSYPDSKRCKKKNRSEDLIEIWLSLSLFSESARTSRAPVHVPTFDPEADEFLKSGEKSKSTAPEVTSIVFSSHTQKCCNSKKRKWMKMIINDHKWSLFANICKPFCDCLDRSSPSLQLLLTFSPYSPGANITCALRTSGWAHLHHISSHHKPFLAHVNHVT